MSEKTIRLKYVAESNRQTLPEDTPADFAFHYVDISAVTQGNVEVPDEQIIFEAAPSRARRRAESGDTLVSTVRTYLRAVAEVPVSDGELIFSTGFAVIHPDPEKVHPRFLTYQLQGEQFITSVQAISTGVGYPATTATDVSNLPVWLPTVARQEAIAGFLDRETAQIDAVIAKQDELIGLLGERRQATLNELITECSQECTATPIRHLAEVTVGIVITPSAWYTDEGGVMALRGLNVRPEAIDTTDTVYLTAEGHAVHSKSQLSAGDVVVVRTGQAGAAAVVTNDLDGVNAIDLLIVRPGPHLRGDFLAMLLNGENVQEQVRAGSVGALQAHFNVSALKAVVVPKVGLLDQGRVVSEWRSRSGAIDALIAKARHSIALMRERRAALISDAVTGRLDIDTYGKGKGAA